MIKIVFLFIMIIHGIVHLMVFFKGHGLVELNQLSAISKSMGIIWLLTGILFLAVAVLILLRKEWWWIPGIMAVIVSQILIISIWKDAKFGTLLNIIILIAIISGFAVWRWNIQVDGEINTLLSQKITTENTVITEQMIETLPSPVQRWLKNSGIVGQKRIITMYLKQSGMMKLKPDQKKWTKSEAEQYITTHKPGFIWKVNMSMIPLVNVTGRDIFIDGEGSMQIKIATLIPVVNVEGNEKADQSTLQRYLMELMWYPSAAISEYITWESIDEHSAKATMTYNGTPGSVTFHFDEDGDVIKTSAFRYKDTDKNAPLVECIGEIKENRIVDGLKIPTKADISWVLDEGVFTWYKLEIYDVKYNF